MRQSDKREGLTLLLSYRRTKMKRQLTMLDVFTHNAQSTKSGGRVMKRPCHDTTHGTNDLVSRSRTLFSRRGVIAFSISAC